jgi:hypothetical protein
MLVKPRIIILGRIKSIYNRVKILDYDKSVCEQNNCMYMDPKMNCASSKSECLDCEWLNFERFGNKKRWLSNYFYVPETSFNKK